MATEAKKLSGNRIVIIILSLVLLLLGITAMYFFYKYNTVKSNPEVVSKQETEALIDQASKLIELPKDETPTIATVTDKDKLKDQPFFANVENGDKILIFTKAKKAIVIRPKENKLINVGPIAIDQKAQVSVALVNAGGDSAATEKKLTDSLGTNISIVSRTSTKNTNVKSLTVVDISGTNAEAAKQIADTLGGEVGSLPKGEQKPADASIVVYVK